MDPVIFDIETVGLEFSQLDEESQSYFLRFAESSEEVENTKNGLSFYPLTAQIVALAMLEAESQEGAVYYQVKNSGLQKSRQGSIVYIPATEEEMLQHFWKQIGRYDQFVTFNGRLFDCPFIMLRSAMLEIRCTKNLTPYRYSHQIHIDLADQLSFYDCLRRKFSLHLWCQAFGIPSPKINGMNGYDVSRKFHNGEYSKIAQYCMEDVYSTKALYQYWRKYLCF